MEVRREVNERPGRGEERQVGSVAAQGQRVEYSMQLARSLDAGVARGVALQSLVDEKGNKLMRRATSRCVPPELVPWALLRSPQRLSLLLSVIYR